MFSKAKMESKRVIMSGTKEESNYQQGLKTSLGSAHKSHESPVKYVLSDALVNPLHLLFLKTKRESNRVIMSVLLGSWYRGWVTLPPGS